MLSIKRRIGLASVVGILGVAGVVGPGLAPVAGAAPATRVALASVAATKLPNVNITGTKSAAWSPTSLTVVPKTFTKCTAALEAWTITNETTKSQTIYGTPAGGTKTLLGTLAAGAKGGICSEGPAGAKSVFTIKGSKSKLTVTLS